MAVDFKDRASGGHYEKRASTTLAGVGSGSFTPIVTDVKARGSGFIVLRNDGANPCTFEIAVSPKAGGTYTVVPSTIASATFAAGDQYYETLAAERPAYVRIRAKATNGGTTTSPTAEVYTVSD